MKRGIIIVAYWLAAIIFTACILMSLDYDIGHAAIMSLSFLLAYGHFHLLKWPEKNCQFPENIRMRCSE